MEQLCGSILMLILLSFLTMYFVRIKSWQRFEVAILVLMFFKYVLFVFYWTETLQELENQNVSFAVLILSLRTTLGPACHWIYSSQYIKTSFLISSITRKARLLLEGYRTEIDDKFSMRSMSSDDLQKNDIIDIEIRK